MTLYEIRAELENCVDQDTGEVIDIEKLTALIMEQNTKFENVGLWIKNLEAEITAIKAEEETLHKRRKTAENKVASLRSWLDFALDGQRFTTPRIDVRFRNTPVPEIDETVIDGKWMREKVTRSPDRKAVKDALLAGEEIPGARMVISRSMQIK